MSTNWSRYKFRGRAIRNFSHSGKFWKKNEWVISENMGRVLISDNLVDFFSLCDGSTIDPDTVGSWSGRKDKYKEDVYEGHEVKIKINIAPWSADPKNRTSYQGRVIIFSDGSFVVEYVEDNSIGIIPLIKFRDHDLEIINDKEED